MPIPALIVERHNLDEVDFTHRLGGFSSNEILEAFKISHDGNPVVDVNTLIKLDESNSCIIEMRVCDRNTKIPIAECCYLGYEAFNKSQKTYEIVFRKPKENLQIIHSSLYLEVSNETSKEVLADMIKNHISKNLPLESVLSYVEYLVEKDDNQP